MLSLRRWWRDSFDVRHGEYARTALMFLYFFFTLGAIHVLKPVAWSMFLNRFPVERLPYLYFLIAAIGGFFAYLYTKLAVRTSLYAAVGGATAIMVVTLFVFWRLIDFNWSWLLYALAIWVNLFGIVFVSQGWLLASFVFDGREAKRLYGLVGLGAILGAAAGGGLTSGIVERVGSSALMPIGSVFILVAFGCVHATVMSVRRSHGTFPPNQARRRSPSDASDGGTANFTIRDVIRAVARHRHLLVIIGIIITTYIAEVLVEFQFNVFAKQTYSGDDLTAFLGLFNGIYLSIATFVLQFFFTTLLVGRLGVGRTLLISPLSVGAASVGVILSPNLFGAAVARLAEASTRYSVSRTAIELLYLPLPAELKSRTKAFIDVLVDRLGRGIAALLLVGLIGLDMLTPRQLSALIVAIAVGWVWLALRARNEYMNTVRRRVESRRLQLGDARVTVQDTETVRLLEQAAAGSNTRQVIYALGLLAEAPGYKLLPLLDRLADSPSAEIQAKVFELARQSADPALFDRAMGIIDSPEAVPAGLARQAVHYVLAISADARRLAAELIGHSNAVLAEAALEALPADREEVRDLISRDWLGEAANDPSPDRRALAALAVGKRGDEGTDVLHRLLGDTDTRVAAAACRAAGRLGNRDYLDEVVAHLANPNLRRAAIEALVSYGPAVCEALAGLIEDRRLAVSVRRQIPRVLSGVSSQESVNALRAALSGTELTVRDAALRALNRLRAVAPELDYGAHQARQQILTEAHGYFELYAALARFRDGARGGRATALLARTIEDRLSRTVERLFRLLGLYYPPSQIQAAYLAVSHRRAEEFAAVLELLDNILESDLKDVLLPMIDGSPHLLDIGRERFGIEVPGIEEALREQIRTGDTWLAACAVTAVAELKLTRMAGIVSQVAASGDPVLSPVAKSAASALG